MQLKKYQQNCLDILQKYFEQCRITGHAEAFRQITAIPEIADRLVHLKNAYTVWEAIPNTPRVCIQVPTGGGKTIIAASAIKIAARTWCEKEYPLVLWFVPSDVIRRQTAEALKAPAHPYRAALSAQFDGRVRIFDLDEKFTIRPADIAENACVIVATIQSFVKEDTSKYNVYRDNENLESHFTNAPDQAGMELGGSRPKYSFANLLYMHRPIMIVDEAHKAVTDLSQETQRRIRPAAILEFTATPRPANNTLYSVRAAELQNEEMIKLPIVLVEHTRWEQAVDEAIARLSALERDAANEEEYIRPLLLFQAQSKDKDVTVEVLKNYLMENANIPENQIKIATGEQKELDALDLFNPEEPARYIITVEALKEGWDCSFAYILCSLANIKSDTSVEQLLGRVMRMPFARNRKATSLNKAYAYVVSPQFGIAAGIITEKLNKKGFNDDEARLGLQQEPPQNELDPNWTAPANEFILRTKIEKKDVPPSIQWNNNTLFFTPQTTEADVYAICAKIAPDEAASLRHKFSNYNLPAREKPPAYAKEVFRIPRLMVELDGELYFAESGVIFEHFDWNIADYAPARLEKQDFDITEIPGKGFQIQIDGDRLRCTANGEDRLAPFMAELALWDANNLVFWLDRNLQQQDIPQSQMLEWLRRITAHLLETRRIPLHTLMIAKFALLSKLLAVITAARANARGKSYELFREMYRKELDFETGFEFKRGMYEIDFPYCGAYKFTKHFLGNTNIPPIDGGEKGEEFQCAQALDAEPQVQYWVRNIAGKAASFRLPTSTDFFYPDFAAKLHDGRVLIVEYKGGHLATSDDTKEKAMIGALWEKLSRGKGLFLLAVQKEGVSIERQIKQKISAEKA
ncbi:MAG: DEAD/DEAH box helicase family protein [Spirochaetota bacterium]|jgi:type III restriction enzyme|nr:DEAD/DEAH box helicase family protein [Spirochaetota bacterium]